LLLALALIGAGCSMPGSGTTEAGGEVQAGMADLTGTWTGTLIETSDVNRTITLTISHSPPSDEIAGHLNLTLVAGTLTEDYDITATFDGATLRFADPRGLSYTATYAGGTLTGYIAWGCYDCPDQSVGTFTLSRGAAGPQPATVADLNGTWTGSMVETGEGARTFNVTLIITQEAGSSEFYGSIEFTQPGLSDFWEFYLITGTVSGSAFQYHDSGTEAITHYFWGSVSGNTMTAQASFNGYEAADVYGTFTLNR